MSTKLVADIKTRWHNRPYRATETQMLRRPARKTCYLHTISSVTHGIHHPWLPAILYCISKRVEYHAERHFLCSLSQRFVKSYAWTAAPYWRTVVKHAGESNYRHKGMRSSVARIEIHYQKTPGSETSYHPYCPLSFDLRKKSLCRGESFLY